MRGTVRMLAGVKPGRYLTPGTKTGLTGVLTHHAPRAQLIFLYHSTLNTLKAAPESSVYRQSVEALTKHRLAIVEAVKPEGFDAWEARVAKIINEHPEYFGAVAKTRIDGSATWAVERGDYVHAVFRQRQYADPGAVEYDGEVIEGSQVEGSRTEMDRAEQALSASREPLEMQRPFELEDEPALTAEQIEEIENKIGAGLIEEVINVAEGEARLADIMVKAKVWESLEEKPAEGQWVYFERKAA